MEEMQMKEYEKPIMEVIEINSDVITNSCDPETPDICVSDV